ncbi:MAG TPA: AraC family transcriptional regulator [Acidobacteriota bacterium]|nr:AraC family transcriptional regulator [Acidobacteriota bacterium]
MSLVKTEYYKSDILSARWVACRSARKAIGDIESSETNRLILPLRGVCVMHFSRGTQVIGEPNLGLIVPAGRSYRVSHPVTEQDDCFVVEYSSECFRDVMEAVLLSVGICSAGTHSFLSLPAIAARNLIWRRLAQNFASALEVEETGLGLLSYALQHSRTDVVLRRRSSKIPRQIDIAKIVLLTHPEKNWSLNSLASSLNCSPFYLTRSFREYVGMPLHRYQLQTRLAKAIDLLLDSNQDLMTIALNLGFSSHSHFTALFRQLLGFTPNRLREIASCRIAAEMRKLLLAPLS